MQHERLKKAVEKYAEVKETIGKDNYYHARFMNQIISWYVTRYEEEEELACLVRVRHINDHDDIQSDYIAGSYEHTINGAIKRLTYELNKGK